jgi:universal stress protein E
MTFEFRRVVVDIPNPDAGEQPTLAAAMEIAKDSKIRLCLFHCVYHRDLKQQPGHDDAVIDEARKLLLENRRAKLQELADSARTAEIEVAIELAWAQDPFLELVRVAGAEDVDLVISSTQPRTRWERLRLSNQDWQLIRYCPSSLLLVKPGERKRYARALAAIDPLHADDKPASLDHRILEAAKSMCELYGAKLDVINVVMPVLSAAPTVAEPLLATDTVAQEAATEAHKKRAKALLAEHALNKAGINVMVGEPADQIVAFADSLECDLLVMGAVARSALGRLLIGNTAEKVLDAVASDLLIIKPDGVKADTQSNSVYAG